MTTALAPYRDPDLPVDERVADLVARMTRAEKLAQLGAVWAFEFVAGDEVDPARLAEVARDGLGQVTRLAGSTNLQPRQVAAAANEIQRFLTEDTRLGIPAIVHEECLHGLVAWAAPCFQQAIGAAASFDAELLGELAGSLRRRMLATGARQALAPVLDLARDPRWGRIEETYGEDPYLATVMGLAYVRGLQGPDLAHGVVATGKHLVGHGLAEGGLNQAPAHIGPRELRDEQLLPFEAAVRDAGLASMMPAYCDVDGLPCHASAELLDRILRGEWGFDGVVVADYMAVTMLHTIHRMVPGLADAGRLALEAGVDVELPRVEAYGAPLATALDEGRLDEAVLDRSVERVLRLKFRLGLFERPYVELPSEEALASMVADEARIGRELARRSFVLLHNDGVLPLAPGPLRIAVLGPIADSARDLLGDYSHFVHMETLREMQGDGNALGIIGSGRTQAPADELAGRRTVLAALQDRLPDAEVRHAAGTGIRDGDDAGIAEAVALSEASDVAIVVAGERSGLTEDSTTGEFRDRRELGLIGRQQELLEAVVATGTPTILVVVSGRPLALEWAARHCAAILLAWVPGDEGAEAIADVLTGEIVPGGKLPVTVPRSVGGVPLTYRHHPSGGRSQWKGDYVDGEVAPLWPFGHGLSYTTFALSGLRLGSATVPTEGGVVAVSVDVTNTGDRHGDEVVQLYVRDEAATVARPVLELCGFTRLGLDAGECRTITFEVATEQFAYTGVDYRRVVEPGRMTIHVGTSSADLPLSAELELIGPTIAVPERRRFVSAVTVR